MYDNLHNLFAVHAHYMHNFTCLSRIMMYSYNEFTVSVNKFCYI